MRAHRSGRRSRRSRCVARTSPLATHLTLACLIFAYLFGLARYLAFAPVRRDAAARPHPLSLLAALLVAAVFIQIFLGGLVAGLKAGHSFNTWPLMDGALVPSGLWMMSPVWLNHFESVLTVQFQHRIAAYVVVALAVAVFWVIARRADTRHLRGAALAAAGALVAQMTIGIATLVGQIPFGLALLHQGFAVVVVAVVMELWCRARFRRQAGA